MPGGPGGPVTLGPGGPVTLGPGGPGGPVTLGPGGPVTLGPGGPVGPVGPTCCWKVMVASLPVAVAVTPGPTKAIEVIPLPTIVLSSLIIIPLIAALPAAVDATCQVQPPEPFAVKT